VLALTVAVACGQLGTDLDQVVALEVFLPDSGRIEVTDTLRPRARALNGRGDSVPISIYWTALDTILAVVDSATGVTYASAVGTGRLQARAGNLRSNPQSVVVLPPLDSASAAGALRDTITVSAPDSLSDSLFVKAWVGASGAAGRRVVYAVDTIYTTGVTTVTFVPSDTVKTNTGGIAAAQLRLAPGVRPDSVLVTASLRRPDGTLVPGTPLTFVLEFQP